MGQEAARGQGIKQALGFKSADPVGRCDSLGCRDS